MYKVTTGFRPIFITNNVPFGSSGVDMGGNWNAIFQFRQFRFEILRFWNYFFPPNFRFIPHFFEMELGLVFQKKSDFLQKC